MSMVKEITEFTDGYEIDEEVAMVLANKNKHLLDYVKELSEIAITKAVYDLNKFEDYPIDFDEIFPRYMVIDTFVPLMQKYIESMGTLRSKLYLSAQKLIENIHTCGMMITDLGRDIDSIDDFEIATEQVSKEVSELEEYVDIWQATRTILADKDIDKEDFQKVTLKFVKFFDDESTGYTKIFLDRQGEYEDFSFLWPIELTKLIEIECLNFCQIDIPANTKITLTRYGAGSEVISASELKEQHY